MYTQYFSNGDRYEGEWLNGKMEHGLLGSGKMQGKGTYYLSNGEKYVGDWKDCKMDGNGIYYWTNGER